MIMTLSYSLPDHDYNAKGKLNCDINAGKSASQRFSWMRRS